MMRTKYYYNYEIQGEKIERVCRTHDGW